jgi:formylglycine-generating enzyme required for sulfatase activity
MAQVFISYSRKDLSFVEHLAADLKKAGLNVWYDVSGISGGSRWRAEIENAIRLSKYLIVILSPDSIESDWVEREFLFASNLKRKIIPVMYRSCELPLSYLDLNYIDVQGEKYTNHFSDILRALDVSSSNLIIKAEKVGKPFYYAKILAVAAGILTISILLIVLGEKSLFALSFFSTPTSTELPLYEETNLTDGITDSEGVEMVLVPSGAFTMGSTRNDALAECNKYRSDCQRRWFEDEQPSHVLSLAAFYIDKYEVSNASYRACEEAGGCQPPDQTGSAIRSNYYNDPQFNHFPVIYVNWDMANSYCIWRGGYLPTEAQWEKAARGTNGNTYPWGNDFDAKRSNFCDINCASGGAYDDSYKDTAPVDSYPEGVGFYGSHNMAGNVWEWVADWYAVYPGGDLAGSNYFEPSEIYRVIRGGAWDSSIDLLRTTNRDPRKPGVSTNNIGFRCAKDTDP